MRVEAREAASAVVAVALEGGVCVLLWGVACGAVRDTALRSSVEDLQEFSLCDGVSALVHSSVGVPLVVLCVSTYTGESSSTAGLSYLLCKQVEGSCPGTPPRSGLCGSRWSECF